MSRQLNKARERWLRQAAIQRARVHPKKQGMGDAGFIGAFVLPAAVILGLTVLLSKTPAQRRQMEEEEYR